MQSSLSTTSNARSFLMLILAVLVVFEITSTFAAAYPASYSGYYSPIGLEEQSPNYMNLQQAIARLRQAFVDNNDLENANNIDQAITDLLQLTKAELDIWFKRYQEEISFTFNPDFKGRGFTTLPKSVLEPQSTHSNEKRSEIAQMRRSQTNRLTLDGTLKRTADFGALRGHTGEKEYGLRYWNHLGKNTVEPDVVHRTSLNEPRKRRNGKDLGEYCRNAMLKSGQLMDFGTRGASESGSMENCLLALRSELFRIGK